MSPQFVRVAGIVLPLLLLLSSLVRGQGGECDVEECNLGFQTNATDPDCWLTTRCTEGQACSTESYFTVSEGCFWLIEPKKEAIPENHVIALTFDLVDIRPKDVLIVLDGDKPDADGHSQVWIQSGPLNISELPGHEENPPIICKNGAALIELYAVEDGTGDHEKPDGFNVKFEIVESEFPPATPVPSSDEGCDADDPNPSNIAWATSEYGECKDGVQTRDVVCHYFSTVVRNLCCEEFSLNDEPSDSKSCGEGVNFTAFYVVGAIVGCICIVGIFYSFHNRKLRNARTERVKNLQKSSMDILESDEKFSHTAPSGLSTAAASGAGGAGGGGGTKSIRQKYQYTRMSQPPPPPVNSSEDSQYRNLQPQQLQQFPPSDGGGEYSDSPSPHAVSLREAGRIGDHDMHMDRIDMDDQSHMSSAPYEIQSSPRSTTTTSPPLANAKKVHSGYSQLLGTENQSAMVESGYTDLRVMGRPMRDGDEQVGQALEDSTAIEVKQQDDENVNGGDQEQELATSPPQL